MTDTNADMDVKPTEPAIVVEKRDDGIVRPGDLSAKLQACRERADLDQDQAAIAMRLSPAMIKALETENFAELPDPPYVRGYLRSYARLDESNPQDLIRTYELLRGADPDSLTTPPPISLTRVQHKPSISPTTVRMLALGAFVLLLGVLSMIPGINSWVKQTWHSFAAAQPGTVPTTTATQNPEVVTTTTPTTGTSTDLTAAGPVTTTSSPALATTTQDNPAPTTPSELVQPSTTVANPSAVEASATIPTTTNPAVATTTPIVTAANTSNPAVPIDVVSTLPSTTDPAATSPTSTTATATTGTLTPATASTTDPAATTLASTTPTTGTLPTTPTDPTATPAVDPNKPADASATTQQPIDGEVMVRMEFTQEVWMQVRDGSNKAIFEALNSPNTWKQFKTRTPLTFKIGNAPGVKLYLNGQAYDHAKYTRGSVARFTVN